MEARSTTVSVSAKYAHTLEQRFFYYTGNMIWMMCYFSVEVTSKVLASPTIQNFK
jgi:hypothetical protein